MKATELRIGNWVSHKEKGFVKIYGIDERWCDITNGQEFGVLLENITPIPLIPAILEKCGFVIKCGDDWDKIYKLNFVELSAISGDSFQYQLKIQHFTPCAIDYLHQLQNLFFALTGEELEFKRGDVAPTAILLRFAEISKLPPL